MKSVYTLRNVSSIAFIMLLMVSFTLAQEKIGGPYQKDANTVLLLHFDGDLTNPADLSDDGVGHGNISFFPRPNFGQCLRFDNDALSDSSYVTVPDNDNLDLTGSWTIEGWINVFTFGQSSSDHRWVPRLVIKPGDEAFWQPNYWVELWGDNRFFQVGFHDSTQSNWPAVTSAPNVMSPGQWVHLTFIRDDSRKILIQMVHNEALEMIWFGSMSYANLPCTTPVTTHQDVHIGWAGAVGIPTSSVDSWLDGFVDEIRISNIVRDFPVPPIITGLKQIANQEASATSYEVTGNVSAFSPTGNITDVTLRYSTDKGTSWNNITMVAGTGDEYTASIPQQPTGSIIQYYMVAKDDKGLESLFPTPGNSPLSFGVYSPNSIVFDLNFEEGNGPLIDHSPYNQNITFFDGPFYSTDAVSGNYAYEFPADKDSAFFWVDSPFLTSKEFALDFWFKAEGDTILPYIRMIIRPTQPASHVEQNYYVRTEPNNALSARYMVDPNLTTRTKDNVNLILPDGILKTNKWFHVQFERSNELAIVKVFDQNGNLLGKAFDDEDIALNPPKPDANAPLRIGWAGNSWDGTIRKLNGKMDDIKVYNYAALGLDTSGVVSDVAEDRFLGSANTFDLVQNYPNPFNPETIIKYQIPSSGNVNLVVYDLLGRKVKTLVDGFRNAGSYEVNWNSKNDSGFQVSSGIYFYSLQSGDMIKTLKMILMR